MRDRSAFMDRVHRVLAEIWWIFLWMGGFLLRLLPVRVFRYMGHAAGFLIKTMGFRRQIVENNLAASFGTEKSLSDLRRLRNEHYRHLGTLLLELWRNLALTPKDVRELSVIENAEKLHELRRRGQGVILVCGHFGNWELAVKALSLEVPFILTVKKIRSQIAQLITERQRISFPVEPNYASHSTTDLKRLFRLGKNNEVLAFIIDQHNPGGEIVDFLGRPAMTSAGLWLLHRRLRCPVLPVETWRDDAGVTRIRFWEPIEYQEDAAGNEQRERHWHTQVYTSVVEAMVRRHIPQWLWIHRRWKVQAHDLAAQNVAGQRFSEKLAQHQLS